jgi:putative aminopeptidase FrvX
MSVSFPGGDSTFSLDLDLLFALLQAHGTPGDEDEVRSLLSDAWGRAGLSLRNHGTYAISAALTPVRPDAPTLLICAHMDSPGFIVECLEEARLKLVPLGGAHFTGEQTAAILKTDAGKVETLLCREEREGEEDDHYYCERQPGVEYGDRLCYQALPEVDGAGLLSSPFLDNRLGCFLLCQLAKFRLVETPWNIVIGATACEELGGFGAPVLAQAVKPDLVICLDATYESPKQDVHIGKGPVLTLSDASTLLSCAQRDLMKDLFAEAGLPLQTEVYNYSGTDSRAFPHQGLPAPVYALLLATQGNHTPRELGSLHDVSTLLKALLAICTSPSALCR